MGANDKAAATFHPLTTHEARVYECPECEKLWATPSASQDCCGDWLGYD